LRARGGIFTVYDYFEGVNARVHIAIRGAVQGVGFRPFVYRLAVEMRLGGWVLNSPGGVFIEAEGDQGSLDTFILRVGAEKPPLASVQSMECTFLDPCGSSSFEILKSTSSGESGALVLPDIATCPECLAEILDPANRRHMYPFTNCTHCGPRFTIIESLPYDRPNTSMKSFPMCDDCRREYADPADRRFHAQPIACPACGPRLALWDDRGNPGARDHDALLQAAHMIREGRIVALKGIGGFQILADAGNDDAVNRLRSRKHREEKPFALMAPDIAAVRSLCEVSPLEERVLVSGESPIVLLKKKRGAFHHAVTRPGSPVAPGNPFLGIMLPSSPLHHILLGELAFPVVATSGNLTDEPICTDEQEAVRRLGGIADAFLVHNRPIVRHADDSIVRVMLGRELVTRRARGFSPLPVRLGFRAPEMLAVGAHLKNTVAVSRGENVFISQHIGDLETKESLDAFHRGVRDMLSLFSVTPVRVVSDLHPDYLSTGFAQSAGFPLVTVQHHHAHVASCMAENGLRGTVLGISWDGTGYGTDGTIWGGEFLVTDGATFERAAALKRFRLPGGEKAIREPRRQALGLLFEMFGPDIFGRVDLAPLRSFTPGELTALRTMLERGVNAPYTTSAGRLFDAVASITALQQMCSYEGQAAMALEFALGEEPEGEYPFDITASATADIRWTVDWSPMVRALLKDVEEGTGGPVIAARFHNGLAEAAVDVARKSGENRVVLSGGCFQNRYLTERVVRRLREEGFRPYWHQRVPPNDGGIALGQIAVASERMLKEQAIS
jgi:hydrogenase maturation protein HypF